MLHTCIVPVRDIPGPLDCTWLCTMLHTCIVPVRDIPEPLDCTWLCVGSAPSIRPVQLVLKISKYVKKK